ncbi:MAG: hypothetical protein KDB32_12955, partial [Planctomycetes bacterium]|nr:hypothetical protein [Planctomycetota bacterium]
MQFAYAKNSATVKADALIVPVFEGAASFKDYAYGDKLQKLFAKGDFDGKAGQTQVLPANGAVAATRVVLLGLGKRAKASSQTFGEALAGFFRGGTVNSSKLKHVA